MTPPDDGWACRDMYKYGKGGAKGKAANGVGLGQGKGAGQGRNATPKRQNCEVEVRRFQVRCSAVQRKKK